MKIQAFLFTKDRASQCRLLLESFRRNCPQLFQPYILWKASDASYRAGYEKLQDERLFPDAEWVEERYHVRHHFVEAMEYAKKHNQLFCIYTDDCIFYRSCSVWPEEIETALDAQTICFSFRLGLNTTVQNYVNGQMQPALESYQAWGDYTKDLFFIRWNWRSFKDTDNYGYPIAMDGCAYRATDLLHLTKGWNFDTFRTWEGASNGPPRREKLYHKPHMAAFNESCVVNVPVNSMQWPPLAAGKFHPVSAADLNQKYMDGYVIDLDGFDFSSVRSAHAEFPIKFRKA